MTNFRISISVMLVAGLLASCETTNSHKSRIDYAVAMDEVRAAVTPRGIPRNKIFYHFQLYGVPSTRMMSGARGGYSSVLEYWNLPDGSTLAASKHARVRNMKITPIKEDEPSCLFPIKEKYYREQPLEPYFDTLYLNDSKKRRVSEIKIPRT